MSTKNTCHSMAKSGLINGQICAHCRVSIQYPLNVSASKYESTESLPVYTARRCSTCHVVCYCSLFCEKAHNQHYHAHQCSTISDLHKKLVHRYELLQDGVWLGCCRVGPKFNVFARNAGFLGHFSTSHQLAFEYIRLKMSLLREYQHLAQQLQTVEAYANVLQLSLSILYCDGFGGDDDGSGSQVLKSLPFTLLKMSRDEECFGFMALFQDAYNADADDTTLMNHNLYTWDDIWESFALDHDDDDDQSNTLLLQRFIPFVMRVPTATSFTTTSRHYTVLRLLSGSSIYHRSIPSSSSSPLTYNLLQRFFMEDEEVSSAMNYSVPFLVAAMLLKLRVMSGYEFVERCIETFKSTSFARTMQVPIAEIERYIRNNRGGSIDDGEEDTINELQLQHKHLEQILTILHENTRKRIIPYLLKYAIVAAAAQNDEMDATTTNNHYHTNNCIWGDDHRNTNEYHGDDHLVLAAIDDNDGDDDDNEDLFPVETVAKILAQTPYAIENLSKWLNSVEEEEVDESHRCNTISPSSSLSSSALDVYDERHYYNIVINDQEVRRHKNNRDLMVSHRRGSGALKRRRQSNIGDAVVFRYGD